MKVDFARANNGFLKMKSTPTVVDDENNFEKCLKAFIDFEELDLLGFDGLNATIESIEEPTNSIFFYKNDTGSFLYQITNATPLIHKNKLLWNIQTTQIDDLSKINNIIQSQFTNWRGILKKTIPTTTNKFNSVVVKNNFSRLNQIILPFALSEPIGIYSGGILQHTSYTIYTLKLKFAVNPLLSALGGYNGNAPDGSWNFYFPYICGCENYKLKSVEDNIEISLSEIISKYSTNLKSIEVLPFLANSLHSTNKNTFDINVNTIASVIEIVDNREVGENRRSVLTDAGIFITSNTTDCTRKAYSRYFEDGTPHKDIFNRVVGQEQYSTKYFNKILNIGGGAKGFLRTPMANIPLDFNIQNDNNADADTLFFTTKEDGFVIQGTFNAIIPPHYINYYTDSSGNIFYANATTNAFAFRELERDKINKDANAKQQTIEKFASGIVNAGVGIATGNGFSITSAVENLASGVVDIFGGNASRNREYENAKASLQDKIETESLLAEYTGKQVLGSVSIGDFYEKTNGAYMVLFIETNYIPTLKQDSSWKFIPQKDYDFAVSQNEITGSTSFYQFCYDTIFKSSQENFGQFGLVLSLQAIDDLNILGNTIKMTNDIFLPIRYNM